MTSSTTNNDSKLTSAATGEPIEYWMITTTDDKGNKASTKQQIGLRKQSSV
jgi:hypothetical protein